MKNVIITGASAGLGRCIAHEFARKRARIGLIARSAKSLEEVKAEVIAIGGDAVVLPCDVSDAERLERAAERFEAQFGPIDVWVNNAMVSVFSPVHEMQPDEYKRVTEVTYLGFVYGTICALKRMRQRNRGSIVQVGSALAYRSIPLQSAYCAAKHAIKGFTESLLCELIHDKSNIKVSMVHMPALNTAQFNWVKSRLPNHPQPVPPIYQPEVGARAVVWAAEHGPRELLVAYPTVEAVLGEKVIPAYLDHYLAETCYSGQQTTVPVPADRPNNLYESIPELATSHGIFDDQAREFSPEVFARTHGRLLLVLTGATVAGIGIANVLLRRRAS
jgi:NAD(P)-dependent dehydrogenase (short-subunit alcohol dehydrogenase family)